jgi:multicomponent Na+:H+ antiporter subunit B
VTEAVGAVTFDLRALDSLGEETIFFAAVVGVAVALREQRDEDDEDPPEEAASGAGEVSEAVRLVGLAFVPLTVALGLYVVAHGLLSPGGGFQGGGIVASGLVLVYVAGDLRAYRTSFPDPAVDPADAAGLAGYAIVGLVGLLLGTAVLDNVLPFGTLGRLTSGGMMPLLSVAVGLEVTAGLILVSGEFLGQLVRSRERRHL